MASVDCTDKVCSLTHKIVEKCIFYIATNNSACNIPCDLTSCLKQVKFNYYCSIWHCEDKFTTTTTATTSMSPDTTSAPPPTNDFSLLTLISLSGNVLFFLLLLLICLLTFSSSLKRKCIQCCGGYKSYHSPSENIPLRSARSTRFYPNQERSQPRDIIPSAPNFSSNDSSLTSNLATSSSTGNLMGFSTINLNDEANPQNLVNPDSIEAAAEEHSGAAVLNISEQSVSFKRPKKNFFSKKFWNRSSR